MLRLACFGVLFACLPSQDPKPEQKLPAAQPMTPEALAGNYAQSSGFVESTLDLSADRHFSYNWFDDTGKTRSRRGIYEIAVGEIRFKITNEPEEEGLGRGPPANLHVIRWGKRNYLVEDAKLPVFITLINLGAEPRPDVFGVCYVNRLKHNKDWALPEMDRPVGFPELPEPWRDRLLKTPVEGKIVALLPENRARVNLGSADGLKQGMVLLIENEKLSDWGHPYGISRIVSVEEHRSTIESIHVSQFEDGLKVDRKVRSRIEEKYSDDMSSCFRSFRVR